METFFSRYRNILVLAGVLVAQFFLLAVQVRRPFPAAAARVDQEGVRAIRYGVASVVTPPESVLHKGGLSIREIWSNYLDLIGVREENVQLRQEVEQLRMEQASLAEDARQGERLQDLLAFRANYINATVPAQVVGTGGTDRSRLIFLDKGSDDGIAVDMPVITPDGIVGRVREVYPHTSQVLEISDMTSAAGVLVEQTRTRGILRGNASGQPEIVNLMPDDRIKPGQEVLTSGGDQIFPRGLPVGVVDHVAPDPDNEPMVDVILKPAANLGRLEEVLVVTGVGSAPTERARHDVAKSELMAAGERAAQEAAAAALADAERASDVLAQRLPSRYDQSTFYAPDATADASPATTEAEAKPLHPPAALHADHYTPTDVPSAASLKPGERYAPLVEGTAADEPKPAKAGSTAVNTTDTAPVGTNPAFAAAVAAMNAQRKAEAETKAAEAARRYAATHPAPPVVPGAVAGGELAAGGAAPAGPASSTGTANASATSTSGSATAAPAVRYVNRTNADGTITRVAVPLPKPPVEYIKQINADGTQKWIPVPPAGEVRYMNRTNADGTVTRVAVPAPSASEPRYIARVNADGTIAHIRVQPAAAAGTAVSRTNADGTVTHVASAAGTAGTSNAAQPVRYTTRTNADGTVVRVPVPSTGAAAGTPKRSASTASPGTAAAPAVKTHVVSDGPLPAGNAARPTTPKAKTTGPTLVPDDGSKPPAPKPAPPPQEQH
jgi:rod shape-determining protein MreC